MFDEIIPMLARMSFLSDNGEILLPHHPWVMANVYNNEKKYRPLFNIDFIKGDEKQTVIDKAHAEWKGIDEGFEKLGYDLDQIRTKKNEVLYNNIIKFGKKYQTAASLYAQQWDFVEQKAIEDIRWVRLRPKTIDSVTKLNPYTGKTKHPDKSCISLGTIESGHKEEVANVKMCLGDNDIDHKQSTLILGLVRNQKASPNDKPCYCFDEMERSDEGKE